MRRMVANFALIFNNKKNNYFDIWRFSIFSEQARTLGAERIFQDEYVIVTPTKRRIAKDYGKGGGLPSRIFRADAFLHPPSQKHAISKIVNNVSEFSFFEGAHPRSSRGPAP